MHKLLYFATIGLLAFSIGGCGDGGGNTASPSPTPSAASPSPAAAASPTPGTQAFPSPVVAAQPPGLIRSTNPDQRAKQSQTAIDNKKNQPKNTPAGQPIPPGPLTPNPAQIDPFGPLPPIAVQNPGPAGTPADPAGQITTNPLPKLASRQIALLPKLPVIWESKTNPQPAAEKAQGRDLPAVPQIPGIRNPQNPTLSGSEGSQVGRPRPVPELNVPPFGSRPGQPGLGGGDGRNPGPPQPIAARPLGVPNLPPLPVENRPPQWRDPNPPPVRQVPAGPPPPPSTDLATGTEVSGVVKVGNETQVIVRVPSEPTSRYVKVGQRLSNGRVLVKRVDVKSGADPIVILEENGVEVAKAVGEKPPSSEPKPANAVISSLPNTNKAMAR